MSDHKEMRAFTAEAPCGRVVIVTRRWSEHGDGISIRISDSGEYALTIRDADALRLALDEILRARGPRG